MGFPSGCCPSASATPALHQGGSSVSTDSSWSQVVAGSPHSFQQPEVHPTTDTHTPVAEAPAPPAASAPAVHPPASPAASVTAVLPPPVPIARSYSDLLRTISSLQKENEDRWTTQNDRHSDYLARMKTLDATLAAHTALSTSLVDDVSDLRSQTLQAISAALSAHDIAATL